MAKSNSFIKLDRQLIRVLGLNNAVVFCHLLGLQDSINNKRDKQDAIYQQQNRLIFDLGLSKATIIKSIKYLEDIKLLHTIKNTEGNKTKYLIDKSNYNYLMQKIDDIETTSIKKNKQNATSIKKDVLNLYYEWCNNNTTSSNNYDTTNKDLKEKRNKLKNKNKYRQLLSDSTHNPITINYNNNGVFIESITYQFIPLFFKESYTDTEIYKTLNQTSKASYNEIQILEYFLKSYYQYYGVLHKQETAPKIAELLQHIHSASNKPYYDDVYNDFKAIIDEFFNTPNNKSRDLTLYLFLSNDNGYYSWINTIANRIGY